MGGILRHIVVGAWLALAAGPAAALELFGVELEATDRDALRAAVEDAGAELIREGGDEAWFDVYDSAAVLPGSRRLYLGFVKADARFAFAEYEFVGLDAKPVLAALRGKYGPPETRKGSYLSDRSYRWQRDGVEIELSADWQNYRVLLRYAVPDNLVALRAERAAGLTGVGEKPPYSAY